MDMRVFPKAELDREGWPPAHQQCRALVNAVLQGETYKIARIPSSITRGRGFSMADLVYGHSAALHARARVGSYAN